MCAATIYGQRRDSTVSLALLEIAFLAHDDMDEADGALTAGLRAA